jgi:hypothetical protein
MHEASLETIMLLMHNSDICDSLCGWNSIERTPGQRYQHRFAFE